MSKTIMLSKLFGFVAIALFSNLTQAQDITATQLGTQRITAVQTKTPLATPTLISEQAITAGPIKPISPCYTYTSTVPYTGPIPKYCPIDPRTCPPHILCIEIKTASVTVPCPRLDCPKTPTATVTGPKTCPTCVVGCDTTTTTVKVTPPCPRITLN